MRTVTGARSIGWFTRITIVVPRTIGNAIMPIMPPTLPAPAGAHGTSFRPPQKWSAARESAPVAVIAYRSPHRQAEFHRDGREVSDERGGHQIAAECADPEHRQVHQWQPGPGIPRPPEAEQGQQSQRETEERTRGIDDSAQAGGRL